MRGRMNAISIAATPLSADMKVRSDFMRIIMVSL
jgi:hypothetical protein